MVLVEDVLTTGTSVRETIGKIISEDVDIIGCVCVLNRSGKNVVPETNIPLVSVWEEHELVKAPLTRMNFSERAQIALDPMAKKIFQRLHKGQTNLSKYLLFFYFFCQFITRSLDSLVC